VVNAWPSLPESVRVAILQLVEENIDAKGERES
jgi:hypothetical protein